MPGWFLQVELSEHQFLPLPPVLLLGTAEQSLALLMLHREVHWDTGKNFTVRVTRFCREVVQSPSLDVSENHLGAILRRVLWDEPGSRARSEAFRTETFPSHPPPLTHLGKFLGAFCLGF